MVGDAIENCLMYAGNFDPDKSKNPFAYFTQITYYAFLRRIQREKKQDHIKYKLMEAADAKGELAAILDPDGANKNPYAAHLRLTDNDIVNMEPKKKRKKRAKGSTGDGELF
jgi:DNA-directed RNA polymerase specialized sigma24 family protein